MKTSETKKINSENVLQFWVKHFGEDPDSEKEDDIFDSE